VTKENAMSDPQHQYPPPDRSVKVPHLVFGLLFLGASAIWAIGESGRISGERLTLLAPVVLIGAGLIGLVASLAAGRNRHRRERSPHEVTPDPGTESYSQLFDTDVDDTTQHDERQS
jgi:hypothetical protein